MIILVTLSCAFYAAPMQHLPYDYTILMDGVSCECIYDHVNKIWMSCEHIQDTGCFDPHDDMCTECNAWIEDKQKTGAEK